ncbi:nuclear receptor coactivator 5 [Babesia caballi]|uniref:Nuclear receptor coactivator 5 n=1 Tax=Babesia caballi TaxID=5871 RepID=A0AAV4M0I7_BABCB|nr:nuclear receptor coactivator 5 [Babesia caballi]
MGGGGAAFILQGGPFLTAKGAALGTDSFAFGGCGGALEVTACNFASGAFLASGTSLPGATDFGRVVVGEGGVDTLEGGGGIALGMSPGFANGNGPDRPGTGPSCGRKPAAPATDLVETAALEWAWPSMPGAASLGASRGYAVLGDGPFCAVHQQQLHHAVGIHNHTLHLINSESGIPINDSAHSAIPVGLSGRCSRERRTRTFGCEFLGHPGTLGFTGCLGFPRCTRFPNQRFCSNSIQPRRIDRFHSQQTTLWRSIASHDRAFERLLDLLGHKQRVEYGDGVEVPRAQLKREFARVVREARGFDQRLCFCGRNLGDVVSHEDADVRHRWPDDDRGRRCVPGIRAVPLPALHGDGHLAVRLNRARVVPDVELRLGHLQHLTTDKSGVEAVRSNHLPLLHGDGHQSNGNISGNYDVPPVPIGIDFEVENDLTHVAILARRGVG